MSGSPDSTILLLGLSGSGKTNFLVALDVVLDDQSDPDGLVHSGLAADRTYLQPLREQWLRGEELAHTSRQIPPPPHQVLVNHPASSTSAGFHLPDLAGETFDSQFVTRSFPKEFGNRVRQATGLLLFLHCGHNADHDRLEQATFIDSSTIESPEAVSPQADHASEWRLEDASPQAKLVDLLQFVAEIGPLKFPLPVAVVISAWDLVEKAPTCAESEMPKDPVRFFSTRWPLLDQFLQSNTDTFRFRTFGVSARGGGTTAVEVARLTNLNRPSDRILVVDGPHRSKDLTRPVRWLLGLLPPTTSPDA